MPDPYRPLENGRGEARLRVNMPRPNSAMIVVK